MLIVQGVPPLGGVK